MERLRGPMHRFAMRIFRACQTEYPDGNVLFSPFTASTGFLLLYMGADGATKYELERCLELTEIVGGQQSANSQSDVEMAFRHALAVLSKLSQIADSQNTSPITSDYGAFQVFRINKIFLEDGVSIREDFHERVAKMKAEIVTVSFQRNPEEARRTINESVGETMNGKVDDCFAFGSLDRDTSMVLANGICFRARWDVVFDPYLTTCLPFRQDDGKVIAFPMMRGVFNLAYVSESSVGFTYLEIPYMSNSASLLIFLPLGKTSLKDASKNLNHVVTNKLNSAKRQREIDLTLPRFQLQSNIDMKAIIGKMGAKSLFTHEADMSRMSPEGDVSLSAARHTGFFSVDELGTDAAKSVEQPEELRNILRPASSLSDGYLENLGFNRSRNVARTSSARKPTARAIRVVIDRPFLFGVRHNKSGIMVCLGRLETVDCCV